MDIDDNRQESTAQNTSIQAYCANAISSADGPNGVVDGRSCETAKSTALSRSRFQLPGRNETLAAVSAGFGTLAIGFAFGYSSPAIPQLQAEGLLDGAEGTGSVSLFGSLFSLGSLFGCALIGFSVDYFGRKLTLILAVTPMMIGWLSITAARSYIWLYVGRVLTGLGSGMMMAYPVYVAEIASKEFRGAFGMIMQIGTTWGTAISFSLALTMNWQWLTIACMIPVIIMMLSILKMPETPRWLLRQRRYNEAVESLAWLRQTTKDDPYLEGEFLEIESTVLFNHQQPKESLILRIKALRKQIITSLLLSFFQQFSGINAIISYNDSIFLRAGYKGTLGIPAVIFASVKASSTFAAMCLVDRVGRRVILMGGSAGMALSLSGLGAYFYLQSTSPEVEPHWLPLASIIVYAISFGGGGWGAIPGLITAEIFPLPSRAWGVCLCQVSSSAFSFLVTLGFEPLQGYIHTYSVFWLLSGLCLLSTFVVALILPNTQRQSLEHCNVLSRFYSKYTA